MDGIKQSLSKMRKFFDTDQTKSLSFRLDALKKLKNRILECQDEISAALKADLNKNSFEAYATETGIVLHEISYAVKRLKGWAKPVRVKAPLMHFPSSARVYSEPYGIALIMSPWNYPFQLAMTPLIGAIAAGNCAVVKPSDYSKNTSGVISKIIGSVFPPEYITVLTGGREVNKSLLDNKFDYIFFTGSVAVGHTVMESAAKFLTPLTLELGGKSPCIIDSTAKIDLAAKRIVFGKFINAGQTCVAPDYIYVHRSVREQFLMSAVKYIESFFGGDALGNDSFPKIINNKHFERICSLINKDKLFYGGKADSSACKIAPAILDNVDWSDAVMQEEIFGPVMPVLVYDSLDEVIGIIKKQAKPLALYLFTSDKDTERRILTGLSYGGGCINDTIIHVASPDMPFGGVGDSGMGGYHGKASFDTFSHKKSIMRKSSFVDINLRYPPYDKGDSLVKRIMK